MRRVRVGILVDDLILQEWQKNVIDDIINCSFSEVVSVFVCWAPTDRKHSWRHNLVRLKIHKTTEIYDIYEFLSSKFLSKKLSYARSHDIRPLIQDVPILNVVPQRARGYFDTFSDEDLCCLRSLDMDVLVRFGFRILRGEILSAARFGVWSFHHGDETAYRGGPSCFWEMTRGESTIGCILQVLTERLDGGRVIYRSHSSCPETFWVGMVREQHYLKSSAFVRRCLTSLYETGELQSAEPAEEGRLGQLYRKPGNARAAWELGRLAFRSLHRSVANAVRYSEWSLAMREVGDAEPPPSKLDGFRTILESKNWSLADPNVVTIEGTTYCFLERCRPGEKKGHIACFRFTDDGSPSDAKTVIECEHHLSYPFVFEWIGSIYMAVEAAEASCVKIFEAKAFPLRWVEVSRILEGHAVYDPTLFEHDGDWYLFAAIDECGGGSSDELFLFTSRTPLGPWKPHPGNPVVSDVRVARPAGPLLRSKGRILRPAQDCSRSYGRAINMCEVTELSPTSYEQKPVSRIDPRDLGKLGCHTISRSGGYEVIDQRSYKRKGLIRRFADER